MGAAAGKSTTVRARRRELVVRHRAAVDDDAARELEQRCGLRLVAAGVAGLLDLVGGQSDHAADRGVRGEAVVAHARFGDGERDLLADLGFERAGGEGAAAAQVGVEAAIGSAPRACVRSRRSLATALQQCGGKVSGPGGAAQLLGMKSTTLASRLRALGFRRARRGP